MAPHSENLAENLPWTTRNEFCQICKQIKLKNLVDHFPELQIKCAKRSKILPAENFVRLREFVLEKMEKKRVGVIKDFVSVDLIRSFCIETIFSLHNTITKFSRTMKKMREFYMTSFGTGLKIEKVDAVFAKSKVALRNLIFKKRILQDFEVFAQQMFFLEFGKVFTLDESSL